MNRKQLLAAAAAFVMTAAATVTATAQADPRPRSQILFENVISQYAQEFDRAQNELQESVSRRNRRNAIAALNMGFYIENWVGTIDNLGTNTEGKAYIKIRLSPNLNVNTMNNAFSDMFHNTLIEMDSELYQVLYNLRKGQRVTFSGQLFRSDDDFYYETSVTIRGAMKDSDFLLRFTNIKPMTNSSSPAQPQQSQPPPQNFSRILEVKKPRMNGQDVLTLQKRLLYLGFSGVGEADGYYGPKTEGAIKTIQKLAGFDENGKVDRKLWDFIFDNKNFKIQ